MAKSKLLEDPEDFIQESSTPSKKVKNKKMGDELPIMIYTEEETLRKLKYIAYWHKVLLKDVIRLAIKSYIKSYESTKRALDSFNDGIKEIKDI